MKQEEIFSKIKDGAPYMTEGSCQDVFNDIHLYNKASNDSKDFCIFQKKVYFHYESWLQYVVLPVIQAATSVLSQRKLTPKGIEISCFGQPQDVDIAFMLIDSANKLASDFVRKMDLHWNRLDIHSNKMIHTRNEFARKERELHTKANQVFRFSFDYPDKFVHLDKIVDSLGPHFGIPMVLDVWEDQDMANTWCVSEKSFNVDVLFKDANDAVYAKMLAG
jgi:hypothetical protein